MSDLPIFIYVLEDPREPGNIRYVGQTQSLPQRFSNYKRKALGKRLRQDNDALYDWLKHLWLQGVEPMMRVLRQTTKESANELEIKAIAGYRKLGFLLFNLTDGGSGKGLVPRSKGKKLPPRSKEWCDAIGNAKRGKKMSLESRLRMRESKLGVSKPKSARATSKFRGVCRKKYSWQASFNLLGRTEYLGSFKTEEDAARAYDKAAIESGLTSVSLNFI